MHVVLYEPEIPQNTGNIARTCAATGAQLHLIEPLGFALEDKYLKRAGLDYWHLVNIKVYQDFEMFLKANPTGSMYFATTKARRDYTQITYGPKDYVIFGPESRGLPEGLLLKAYESCIRIPMRAQARSLNLSNSVAVVLYEALRQQGFPGLQAEGCLKGAEDSAMPWLDYL